VSSSGRTKTLWIRSLLLLRYATPLCCSDKQEGLPRRKSSAGSSLDLRDRNLRLRSWRQRHQVDIEIKIEIEIHVITFRSLIRCNTELTYLRQHQVDIHSKLNQACSSAAATAMQLDQKRTVPPSRRGFEYSPVGIGIGGKGS
jgi:hypothetical protein